MECKRDIGKVTGVILFPKDSKLQKIIKKHGTRTFDGCEKIGEEMQKVDNYSDAIFIPKDRFDEFNIRVLL